MTCYSEKSKKILPGTGEGVNFFMIELLLSITIIGACAALILGQVDRIIKKAQLTEVYTAFSSERITLIEDFALHGDIIKTELLTQRAGGDSENVTIVDTHQSIRTISDESFKFDYSITGGIFLAKGKISEQEKEQFFLTISPSVTNREVPWNIIWNCGWRKPPAGWVGPNGETGSSLSEEYLLSPCRNTTGY